MKIFIIRACFLLGCTICIASCTKLKEDLYSTLDSENFYKNEQECILAMGDSYSRLAYQGGNLWGIYGTQLVPTDEAVIPYRLQGPFLGNNGIWLDLHQHIFKPNNNPIQSSWQYAFGTVAASNQVIYQIEKSPAQFDGKQKMISELKVLRAYAYYAAMDLFGNIPISLDFADTALPKQFSRAEAFITIEKEFKDNLSNLDAAPSPLNYGRCTKALAFTVLAKMYLNANVWLGRPMWQEAIGMCDSVINLGYYHLEGNYFKNFMIANEDSKENIFVIPYDRKLGFGWEMHEYTLHPAFTRVYDMTAPMWNGISATEAFYNSYDPLDVRINSWMAGTQYDQSGQPLLTSTGTPLVFTPSISGLKTAGESDGVRCKKWEFPRGLQTKNESMDNDLVIFRYADILLMKAEALMRKNGGIADQAAVNLVNMVRERAFANSNNNYTVGTLNLDELLKERGRELAWEGLRRQDLIRFGKWENAWFGKQAEGDKHTEIFPIPSNILPSNPNLKQNPGY
jgi:starch-binding outer membrane protein, SusD/RagB family